MEEQNWKTEVYYTIDYVIYKQNTKLSVQGIRV